MSITVHHLNKSRSLRIVWLLEELGLPYHVECYQRDPVTNLAPPELKKIHPLGKAPLLEDDGVLIQESGAIVHYLCERYGKGRFLPAAGTDEALRNLQLMHFAEGSVMTPILLRLYVGRLGEAGKPLHPRINEQLVAHFDYLENELRPSGHFVGDNWSGADVMLSFPAELAALQPESARWPKLQNFIARIHARDAWKKAVQATGENLV